MTLALLANNERSAEAKRFIEALRTALANPVSRAGDAACVRPAITHAAIASPAAHGPRPVFLRRGS